MGFFSGQEYLSQNAEVMCRLVPMRHPVISGSENAVQGTYRDVDLFAGLRLHDALEQRIDHRAFDPREISTAVRRGTLGTEIVMQFVAGCQAHDKACCSDIEVERFHPSLELRGVDRTDLGIDSEQLEVFDKRRGDAVKARRVAQKLDAQLFALAVDGACGS